MGDLWGTSIGRSTTIRRSLIRPFVALALSVGLVACADNELSVVAPSTDDQEPQVEAFATPGASSTDAPGATTTSTTTTSSTTTTTTAPPTTTTTAPATTTEPAPPTPPAAGAQAVADQGAAERSLTYVNQQRASNGRGALVADDDLDQAALDWARELAASGELGHNPRLREVVPDRYGWVGENVAMSWTDANIDQMWWDSEGHRNNILGENYTAMGIAFVVDSGGQYWAVQVFGG